MTEAIQEPDKDIILNRNYVVATRKGEGQQVTLVNPNPKKHAKMSLDGPVQKNIMGGLVIESGPNGADPADTVTRIYCFGDLGISELRAGLFAGADTQLLRDETNAVQARAHSAHKLMRKVTGGKFDADIALIGEYNSGNLSTLQTMLNGLQQTGHFGMDSGEPGQPICPSRSSLEFRKAVKQAVELSREKVTGDGKALAQKYEDVNTAISETVKGPKK